MVSQVQRMRGRAVTKGERAFTKAVVLGLVSGLRSLLSPALYSYHLAREGSPDRTFLANPKVAQGLQVAAVAELAADKMPFMPSRLMSGPLTGRAVMGALVGYTAFEEEGEPAPVGAVVGALAALAGSYVGYGFRKTATKGMGLPDLVAAVIEDAAAVSAAQHALTLK